ncbi:MAG: cysteine desulfurase-like protein [Gammaproteobacteria bacterium]|nr:cysteine desulfurase-like protein [Gammaproteobacteria bacterium]NND61490.1 cysteine desulfurase-like protein [Gammaproteobacteria bacterium]
MSLDPVAIRQQFPALSLSDDGQPRIYFDNPAGTQVPGSVADAMRDCLLHANANLGGPFPSSVAAGRIVDQAHAAMADLLNANSSDEIIFGANMTTLTFQMSRALGQKLSAGDEIIVTELDHDANVSPWLLLARDLGLTVHKIRLDTETFRLDLDHYASLLNDNTRLVCVGHASNLLGTLNDIPRIVEQAHAHDALVFVDAVHSVPHMPVDVQALGCDLLACSPYKFFGPHQGVLWGRHQLLQSIEAYRLRPAPAGVPGRFETGTQSHESMAGTTAAVDYIASLASSGDSRRSRLRQALTEIREYEMQLCRQLLDGLEQIPGLQVYGITGDNLDQRAPTVSFRIGGVAPDDIANALAERNIFAWAGHSYAVEPCRALGILDSGGVLRVGIVHYNDSADVQYLLDALGDIAQKP